MNEIQVVARSSDLTINGHTWSRAPLTDDLCRALAADAPIDGDFVIIGRKKESVFRYFEDLGISIVEKIPEQRVTRITLHFQAQGPKKTKPSHFGGGTERATAGAFQGVLELNGKTLRAPFPFSRFPHRGELEFIHRIAVGTAVSASVGVRLRLVERVSFDFESNEDDKFSESH